MANIKISELNSATSATTDSLLVIVNDTNTTPVTNRIFFSAITTQIISKYESVIGDGVNTEFTVTHNLNKTNVVISVRENISNGYVVYPDIQYINNNSIKLTFVIPPTTNQYYLSILSF